jgi:lipopolysaccharide export system permease protein
MTINKSHFGFATRIFSLSLMDRYIVAELILPFLFGMGLFSSLGIAVGSLFDLVRQVSESKLLVQIALQVLLLKMPEFIGFAIPMSVLLATLMVYSRLANDSEILALRSSGISIYRVVIPAIVFSLVITTATFLFKELVVPATNYQASIILEQALKQENIFSQESNIFYPEYQNIKQPNGEKYKVLNRIFYAESFDGKKMHGLTILDISNQGISQIITSKLATWNLVENTWDFSDGIIYVIAPDGSYRNVVRFERQKLQLPKIPLDLALRVPDYGEMNIAQAWQYLKVLRFSDKEQRIRKLEVRIQEKIAFPFICLVLGLVGAVLGTQITTTGRAINFGICVLTVFAYYLLAFITSSLGIVGILSPILAAWLPNIIILGVGGLLLVKASN